MSEIQVNCAICGLPITQDQTPCPVPFGTKFAHVSAICVTTQTRYIAALRAELATANTRIAALEAERDAVVAELHDAECAVSDLGCELRGIPPKRDAARAGKAGA